MLTLAVTATLCSGQIVFPGGEGPGHGKHIVLVSGDEEYRSEEGLPQLARILAKRCRYAAEAVAPALGKDAAKLGAAVADLQGVLGDLHDAVVAEAWLRQAVVRGPAAHALAAGQLIALERSEAEESRRAWREVWKQASARRLRAWLSQ